MQSLEFLRNVERAADHRIAIALGLQPRLVVDGALERDRVGRILRHKLAQLVDLAVRHLQDAADVAQHAARLQGAEGDDLRDPVAAVLFLHVADHLVAALLAEVDVEIRHRDAFRIEEALEQEPEADRIEIGDGERIGDQRAGAGAAARSDRNALRLRPLDEIGDDQKVAGIFHLLDDAELEGEPIVILLGRVAGRERMPREPPLQAGARRLPQLFGFVDSWSLGVGGFCREAVSSGFASAAFTVEKRGRIGALVRGRKAQRSATSTVAAQRLRQIGEQRRHFRAGLEAVLRRELAAVAVGDQPALGDAEQRIVRLVVLARGEKRLVGRDERQARAHRQARSAPARRSARRHAVALQLDVEAVAEQALQFLAARLRERALAARRSRDRADRSARR